MPCVVLRGSTAGDPSVGPWLTIGNFDGVHLGHRALLERLIARARAAGHPAWAMTFEPLPVEVLRPEVKPPRIQSLDDRLAALADVGLDGVVVEPFDRELSQRPPEWFAQEILAKRLGCRGMVVGWDFRFGRDRAGTIDDLQAWLQVDVDRFGPWSLDGEVVSSSRVRALVQEGDVARAAILLGRPHRVRGQVVAGEGRGRTIGVPTANLAPETALLPGHGVYAVRAIVGGRPVAGAMNVGVRPTFDGVRPSYEVHLLDWSGDLYGQPLAIDFVARIRGEKRFSGPAELVAQIQADIATARGLLA